MAGGGHAGLSATMTNTCLRCGHFVNDPARIEALTPGLTVFGSAYASVSGTDGLCVELDRIVSGRDRCGRFTPGTERRLIPTALDDGKVNIEDR